MSTPINSIEAPFLRSSWDFPDDNSQVLAVQASRSYLAIANNMNARTIGIFPETGQISNGESWVINGQSQSGIRQIYPITGTSPVPHGLNLSTITYFTKCFGSYTDGTNWYGLIYASDKSLSNQISFYITPTDIVILTAGAHPTLSYGIICLEWISQL